VSGRVYLTRARCAYGVVRNCRRLLFVFIALKGVNCCASQPPAAGGAPPFSNYS